MLNEAPIGVIFDCDGTLLDSMGVWREMESEFARRAGGELSPADKELLTTLTTPEAGRFFHEKFGLGASPQDVVRMVGEYMMEYLFSRRHVPADGLVDDCLDSRIEHYHSWSGTCPRMMALPQTESTSKRSAVSSASVRSLRSAFSRRTFSV